RTELLLALSGPEGERRTLSAPLPARPGAVDVLDPMRGRLIARGLLQEVPHGARVILPASVIAGWPHVFAKIERRFGFFDEAGWRPVPAWNVAEVPARDSRPAAVEIVQSV